MNGVLLSDLFPTWRSVTTHPSSTAWSTESDWEDESLLERLLELAEDDLEAHFGNPPEEVSAFGAAVLDDLVNNAPLIVVPRIDVQRNFVRFFIAAKLIEYCQSYGRISLVYDWLLCALSDRKWECAEAAQPVEVDYYPDRLVQFLMSAIPAICGTAPWAVLSFIRSLFYYSWKSAGHRELATLVFKDTRKIVQSAIACGDADLVKLGVEATSAVASWCIQAENSHAEEIVQSLVDLYDQPEVPEEARKLIAITLATAVGDRTGRSSAEWARRALSEHSTLLVQHEPLQMLVASCTNSKDMEEKYDEIVAAIDQFTRECDEFCGGDPVEIVFRRIQLFQVFVPFITGLIRGGECAKAIAATAAWFSVPVERRRTSPTLALLAGIKEGVIYSVEGRPLTIPRDSSEVHRELVEAMNHSFDMNIVVPDDHSFPSRPKVGRRGPRRRFTDELADATAAYYEIDRATNLIQETQGLALFQPSNIGAPLVPLVRSRLGISWPIMTSFEQPADDRPIRKALIWSYGTILGGLEARAVASILEAAGVECSLLSDRELTRDEFLSLYNDESLDLLWVTAHGMFDPREPQHARFEISSDGSQPIYLTDLVRCKVPGPGRRLLFLNICLGASVAVIDAPTKLGLASMLASAEQAVVSHIVEVSSFVAPLFGAGTAVALGRGMNFFDAFSHALDTVRLERDAAFELFNESAPQCREFLEWLKNGTYGVEPDDIRTWGTGAFYE